MAYIAKELRLVVVKLAGKPPKVACVVRDEGETLIVRLSLMNRKFAPHEREVGAAQVLREATARERELGFVP